MKKQKQLYHIVDGVEYSILFDPKTLCGRFPYKVAYSTFDNFVYRKRKKVTFCKTCAKVYNAHYAAKDKTI